MDSLSSIIRYWEVWHLVLSFPAFLIVYRFFDKQRSFFAVMGLAMLWEIVEYFTGLNAYSNVKHFLLNSYKDLGMALIGCLICITLLKDSK